MKLVLIAIFVLLMAQGTTLGEIDRCPEYIQGFVTHVGDGFARDEIGNGLACRVDIISDPRAKSDYYELGEFANGINGTLTIEIYEEYTHDLLFSRKENISNEKQRYKGGGVDRNFEYLYRCKNIPFDEINVSRDKEAVYGYSFREEELFNYILTDYSEDTEYICLLFKFTFESVNGTILDAENSMASPIRYYIRE